ncbi:Sensory box histidine kinase [Pedobacter cryoconitis]|uniref:Sensory box histidine kinase n=1 Tax=Pedobacter cryoconitis TaxID=188932 RepID=A0A127VBT9_9SPHI|nr:PAS domain-containing protein [Pedobacter cryoconitis]AMP98774.1 Sensory box histidine kinase [Pedobacter cryoconitis]
MTGNQQFEVIKSLLGDSGTYYLIAVDMNSNYSYINRRYADIFKPIHGDLVGKNYAITMHPDDQQTCQIVSEMAFKNPDSVFPATIRKYDGHGGFIITRWEYKAVFDDTGVPAGIYCIGHDITELMKITSELQQVKISHSHSVRRHVANLIGLGKIMQTSTEIGDMKDAAKMIVQSAINLDEVIKELYK